MKVIDVETDSLQLKYMIISYKFKNLPNIVCSGRKIYQLPCQIGFKSYGLKEIRSKYHVCRPSYLIESKRYSDLQLKSIAYKVDEKYLVESICLYPF